MLSLGSALAADMPVKALAPAPAFIDWTGVYVGVHAGYGGGMKDFESFSDFAARGFLAGGQIGINKQIASFVFGLEIDGSWADIKGSQNLSLGGPVARVAADHDSGLQNRWPGDPCRKSRPRGRSLVRVWQGRHCRRARKAFPAISRSSVIPAVPGGTSSVTASGSETRYCADAGLRCGICVGRKLVHQGRIRLLSSGQPERKHLPVRRPSAAVTTPVVADLPIEQALHVVKIGANYRFGGIAVDPSYTPVRAAPGYNWTGAYIGAQGGYGLGRKQWPDFADPLNPATGKYNVDGWLAGGTGGVNVQSGVFVFGVEGEWMWTGIKGGQTFTQAVLGLRPRRSRLKPASTGLRSPARVPASSSATSCCSTARAAWRSRERSMRPAWPQTVRRW